MTNCGPTALVASATLAQLAEELVADTPAVTVRLAFGDVGYLDADGFLYLTDRKAFMIISGGANIYPQEIENVLAMHPKIVDVAVIGVLRKRYLSPPGRPDPKIAGRG